MAKSSSPNIKTRNYLRTKETSLKTQTGSKLNKSPAIKGSNRSAIAVNPGNNEKIVSSITCKNNVSTKISEATPPSGKKNNQMQVLAKNNDQQPKKIKAYKLNLSENTLTLKPLWLSDEYISAYFEVLQLKAVGTSGSIYLINPALVHGIKTLNDFIDFLDLPKLEK